VPKARPPAKPRHPASCPLKNDLLALRLMATIPSTFDAVESLLGRILTLAREMKCGKRQLVDIELALREALANAVVHGNRQDPEKQVIVRCFCQPDRGMLLVVEDEGAGFDPNSVPDPTQGERVFESHGRGLFLIRRSVDRVRFSKSGRRLTMVKHLHK
jgi:serine/threonine-protein kinase RsbW